MQTDSSDSLLWICLAILIGLPMEWFFYTLLRSGLHTGKCSNQAGPVDRAENPILYWFSIAILAAWVVLLPVLLVGLVVAAFGQQRG